MQLIVPKRDRWLPPLPLVALVALLAVVAGLLNSAQATFDTTFEVDANLEFDKTAANTAQDWFTDGDTNTGDCSGAQATSALCATTVGAPVANTNNPSAVDNPAAPGTAKLQWDDVSASALTDNTVFQQRSSKEVESYLAGTVPGLPTKDGIMDWHEEAGEIPPNKDDMSGFYAWTDDPFDNMVLAAERLNNNGSFHFNFGLDHNPWAPCPDGRTKGDDARPCRVPAEGDLLLVVDQSGNSADIKVFIWEEPDGVNVRQHGSISIPAPQKGTTGCDGMLDDDDAHPNGGGYGGNLAKSCVNSDTGEGTRGWEQVAGEDFAVPTNVVDVQTNSLSKVDAGPWGSFGQGAASQTALQPRTFFEAYVNLDALGFEPACPVFGTATIRTRSSDSFTAQLKDLAGPLELGIECSVSGHKFDDNNNDGEWQETEAGLEGWQIHLSGKDDQSSQVHLHTTTDENGFYEFANLRFGQYTLCETLQGGWAQTFPSSGTVCSGHTDKDGETIVPGPWGHKVTLERSNPVQEDRDFGNQLPPDVVVNKKAAESKIQAGATATFDITVTNIGLGDAKGVTLNDVLPPGLSWTDDSDDCTITQPVEDAGHGVAGVDPGRGKKLDCVIGPLAGSGGSFSVSVSAVTDATHCGDLVNKASVSASNEKATGNNNDSATITVNCPNINVNKKAAEEKIQAGATATFTITVTNKGDGNAKNVKLNDSLPAGLSWSEDPDTDECTITSGKLQCTIGNLAPDASFSVTVSAVTDGTDCGDHPNTATATVSNEPEGKDFDNSDSATITVNCPNINVNKKAERSKISAGQTARFTITVRNKGDGNAKNVKLNDSLPAGLSWSEDPDTDECTITSGKLQCTIGNLASGADFSVTVSAVTDGTDCGDHPNTATATVSNEPPGKDSDNSDSASITVNCPDVGVTKAGTISYTMVVTDKGSTPPSNVVLDDDLPGDLPWVESPDLAACTISVANHLHCDIAASALPFSVTVQATITDADCDSLTPLLENTATTGADIDVDLSNNAAIAAICPVPAS